MSASRRLALIVADGKSFLSHRLGLARAARDAGWTVTVILPRCAEVARISAEGFEVLETTLTRDLRAPWNDLKAAWQIADALRRRQITVAHNFALKPALIGTLACRLAGCRTVVNTVAGMGYIFINQTLKARLLRTIIVAGFRSLIDRHGTTTIVQNSDDLAAVSGRLVAPERVVLVRGSGVDTEHYEPLPEPSGTPVAALVSRMLWDKGVGELVAAARLLRQRQVPIRIALVGDTDPANPQCIPQEQLEEWHREGIVEYWGFRDNITEVWRTSHIAVLPSYREGLPKALLEAAACARPIVTTDAPGCREMVEDQVSGLLVPVRSVQPLADVLEQLARSPEDRARLGHAARCRVEREFADHIVHDALLAVYDMLLSRYEFPARTDAH
jgi:glycosyltransferase involved in cell wall biosynthesis